MATEFTKLIFLLLLSILNKSSATSKEELLESESKDGKLEIVKQIKKINDDGSYTIGYEADDGSFKIESRDVLGNIKGTYGYLDDSGQIKRVTYSTSNNTELLNKPELPSVVQRIPKISKTTSRTTLVYPTRSSTTTESPRPNYSEVVHVNSHLPKSSPTRVTFTSSTSPAVILQGKPILRSTAASHIQKQEGQLIRPDVTAKPTELPVFRRLKQDIKPVTEESESKNNLRRQLANNRPGFDLQRHIFTLQQPHHSDSTDVYSSSVTTGTPRPLFTTTARSLPGISSTASPFYITKPPQINYPRLETVETTTTTAPPVTTQPSVQVLPNPEKDFVEIPSPYQQSTILVPVSQIRDNYFQGGIQQMAPVVVENVEPQAIYVRKAPRPQFRSIPVQVDNKGFVRNLPSEEARQRPYPIPVPITPRYNVDEDDVDEIEPPVSTRDFQKLLQKLVMRQKVLERLHQITSRQFEPYRRQSVPYYVQREPEVDQSGPLRFSVDPRYTSSSYSNRQLVYEPEDRYIDDGQRVPSQSRRVARLLPRAQEPEEYLPQDVREMLLLKMLQLAINPALPIKTDEFDEMDSSLKPRTVPVRNVEILGEEMEVSRNSRIVSK